MEIIHEAVSTNVMVSKRDIFYRDVALFGTQRSVDKVNTIFLDVSKMRVLTDPTILDYRGYFILF